jgi:hypothetical protein
MHGRSRHQVCFNIFLYFLFTSKINLLRTLAYILKADECFEENQ